MNQWWKFGCVLASVLLGNIPLCGQASPVPIPGGDIIPPFVNQFFPGVGVGFDGLNADPHGITNFRGKVAMGYAIGTATDQTGRSYDVVTDVRVYQGDYVGAVPNGGAGRTKSALSHGTFVEI